MSTIAKARITSEFVDDFRGQLLKWYDTHARELPWRLKTPNPYFTWLSEIMLQQTTVQAVIPYFLKFTGLWPTVHDLADADNDTVMKEWAGLGYYARARNLHKCAKIVSTEMNGVFPSDYSGLKALPGIGDYTAAAISTIAFNIPATVVDGNIERVMARLFAVTDPVPAIKPHLKTLAAPFFENCTRSGDLAQTMMDLGAGICTPKSPKCMLCPVNDMCAGYKQGIAAELPKRLKKKPQPQKHGHVYWITNDKGQVLLEKRPDKGLLGGMIGLPTSEWMKKGDDLVHIEVLAELTLEAANHITHTFTHFDLRLNLHKGQGSGTFEKYFWENLKNVHADELPTLFKKAYNLACGKA